MSPVPFSELAEKPLGEPSASIRKRVVAARQIQRERFVDQPQMHQNAQMPPAILRKYCVLDASSQKLFKEAMNRLSLSARAYDRILKVSRTIADLEGVPQILSAHIAEAIQYRSLDREGWLG